jgi:predicted transcriptional regulator
MTTITIGIATRADVKRRLAGAFRGERHGARLTFRSPALLMKVLSEHRLELLEKMCGAGPMSLREAARRVQRDVKRVHGDVHVLLEAGLLSKKGEQIVFPFDGMKVEFEVRGQDPRRRVA